MNDHEEVVCAQQRDTDMDKDGEVRAVRDKVEKVWRKRLDEQMKDSEQRNQVLENEMDEVREKHRDELARERQRLEARFKETALTDLRREVTD